MKIRTMLLCVAASILTSVLAVQGQVPGINSTIQPVFTLAYDNSGMKPTYSATVAGITAVASQTDMCTLAGSATKVIKVRRVIFTNIPTTAVTEPISIVKRSTASTGAGTAIPMLTAGYDTNNLSETVALAEVWTAAPTVGTLVGVIADIAFPFAVSTGAVTPAIFTFGGQIGQPVVLRGVAEQIAINLSTTTFTGVVGCTFEWTEE